jgi:glutamyl-Q tRNA(Asp) synthetase
MPVRTRFAPSPTGDLHLGHVLAALTARDLSRATPEGKFLLRFEDLDTARVNAASFASIRYDLKWLGLQWDGEPLLQSQRQSAYAKALTRLRNRGLAYPCFCTRGAIRAELERMGAAPHGPEGPLYPGTCRSLADSRRHQRIAAGDPHCWRLDAARCATECGPAKFLDARFGSFDADPSVLGDVVLARKDVATAYHLAVVVDDAYQRINCVTRGEDLLAATHTHCLLQAALGLPSPMYLHHQLVRDPEGKRLAKRNDAMSVRTLRAKGFSPGEVLALALVNAEKLSSSK